MIKRTIVLALTVWMLCVPVFAQECTEHDYELYLEPPTCTTQGFFSYVCTGCGHSEGYENMDALGHVSEEWTLVTEASCSQAGLEESVCSRCGEGWTREIPQEEHSFTESLILPTYKAEGCTLLVCDVCGTRERRNIVEALGHDYQSVVTPPTCTADGYTRHCCSRCQDAYRTDPTEKLGHEYGEGVQTKEPTLETMGRMTYTCVRCDDSYTVTTPKWINPFLDLDKKAYYFTGVLWACNNGITTGVSDQLFSPEGNCTRAQVVTFLWRMEGMPQSASVAAKFSDVPADAYYSQAVDWAVEQGITKGIGGGLFGPDKVCTRCEVVTFLYRAMEGRPGENQTGFLDVSASDYYHDPVYWAYENGITTGTSLAYFSPKLDCTRAQIVTFLYRAGKIPSNEEEIS